MKKGVGNVEESEGQQTKEASEVDVDAGGVFWLNAVEGRCQYPDLCGSCIQGWQLPRKTVKPDCSWIVTGRKEGNADQNRYAPLQAVEEDDAVEGKIIIDSGAADSVMPKDILKEAFPLLPKKEAFVFWRPMGR